MKITPTRVTIQTGLNKKLDTRLQPRLFFQPRSSERRSSRLQKADGDANVARQKIEIGTMLRGHFYNTNRVGYLVR